MSKPTTVLIADDEADIRDFVEIKLTRAGMIVRTAADGLEALQSLSSDPPDVAVLDVMMPALSGIDVLRQIRAGGPSKDVPVILLTAKAQEADVALGFAVGATDYVTKPFSPSELLLRINAILNRTRV